MAKVAYYAESSALFTKLVEKGAISLEWFERPPFRRRSLQNQHKAVMEYHRQIAPLTIKLEKLMSNKHTTKTLRASLLQDLARLREASITFEDARARAALAREIINSLKLEQKGNGGPIEL